MSPTAPRVSFLFFAMLVMPILFLGCAAESENASTPVTEDQDDLSLADRPTPSREQPIRSISDQAFREAALAGELPTVREAIEKGTDINSADENGSTGLMLAAYNGHTDLVKLLLNHGAQLDRRDAMNRTALIYAASGKNPGTVNALLKAGAEVDVVDHEEGWTALMFAAAEGNIEVVRLLLKYGADLTRVDKDGENSIQFAASQGHREVVELLEAEMAARKDF